MITYRYGPYKPEDENNWNMDRLMSMLSEMILRYDVELDEALRMLLNRGLPVNLFLKEGGMDDLVSSFGSRIQDQIDALLKEYKLDDALEEAQEDVKKTRKSVDKKLKKKPEYRERLEQALSESSLDQMFRLKWDMLRDEDAKGAGREMDRLIKNREEQGTIESGMRKYAFTGIESLSKAEALRVLENMDELAKLKEMLEEALRNGDLFNFNLENLAKYLGPESYQEFLERREAIYEKLRELMEEQGQVVRREGEDDKFDLSPASIRRIGRRALEEIFSNLKADSSGGGIETTEVGESENLSSTTRPLEFGDPISHMDVSASVVNALIRTGQSRPGFRDIEVFEGRGNAKSATVILLDMSGSMMRGDRFYSAKKVVLALDSLIRQDYRDERLTVVGFGSLAQVYRPAEIPTLQPFPVTMFNPHIRLRLDLSQGQDASRKATPLYFTNLQRGLQLSRTLLGSGETRNKQIILITDGVPTAHFEDSTLHINYPPSPADFEAALREVRNCTDDDITINTFLLTSDWEMNYFGEESFILQFAKQSMGRIFYPHPSELNKMILVDFIANKKKQFSV